MEVVEAGTKVVECGLNFEWRKRVRSSFLQGGKRDDEAVALIWISRATRTTHTSLATHTGTQRTSRDAKVTMRTAEPPSNPVCAQLVLRGWRACLQRYYFDFARGGLSTPLQDPLQWFCRCARRVAYRSAAHCFCRRTC